MPHPLAVAEELPHVAAPVAPASAPPAPPPSAAPAVVTPAPSPEARIALKDFELDPNEVTARAGTITFILSNEGRYTHDFRVEGNGVDDRAPKVGAGRTLEWRTTLQPGTYKISCPISNHADRGMTGTLVVTGP